MSETDAKERSVFREWVLPIVIGLALGVGLVQLWGMRGVLLHNDVEAVAAEWDYEDPDAQDELTKRLRALGPAAREDLLAAFRDTPAPDRLHLKLWLGNQFAGEPFFGSRALLAIVKDPAEEVWNRRAAALVLVETQRREVDAEAVLPVLLGWVQDGTLVDHGHPVSAVMSLAYVQALPPDWEPRVRDALIAISDPAKRKAAKEDEVAVSMDRYRALYEMGRFIPDELVLRHLWGVALDETDHDNARIGALRALAENMVFDDPASWTKAAGSESDVVRQTVAENLIRSRDPAFDEILDRLHRDAWALTRAGSIATQVERRRPTMLDELGALVEDHDEQVRYEAMLAVPAFEDHLEGAAARQGMLVRKLGESDSLDDVSTAAIALFRLTGRHFGFQAQDVRVDDQQVEESALRAFVADAEGRAEAVRQWQEHFAGVAVWTDGDRREALESMLDHADPKNVEHAKRELDELGR